MPSTETSKTEAAILQRIVQPEKGTFPQATARASLKFGFSKVDQARMSELVQRNQAGELTASELRELESYRRVGRFVDLLLARARLSLSKTRHAD